MEQRIRKLLDGGFISCRGIVDENFNCCICRHFAHSVEIKRINSGIVRKKYVFIQDESTMEFIAMALFQRKKRQRIPDLWMGTETLNKEVGSPPFIFVQFQVFWIHCNHKQETKKK